LPEQLTELTKKIHGSFSGRSRLPTRRPVPLIQSLSGPEWARPGTGKKEFIASGIGCRQRLGACVASALAFSRGPRTVSDRRTGAQQTPQQRAGPLTDSPARKAINEQSDSGSRVAPDRSYISWDRNNTSSTPERTSPFSPCSTQWPAGRWG
jgi:hypothetical protein